MNSIISINAFKFKNINPLYIIEQLKKYNIGMEICFNFNNIEEQKYIENIIYLGLKENLYIQFHGNSNLSIEDQYKYLDLINSYLPYQTNIVLHSILKDTYEDSINSTTIYLDTLLEYIESKNYHLTLSLENLNSERHLLRPSKEYLDPILYNNDKLMFTYDIGHEIVEYGGVTNVSEIETLRINNIHLHTFNKGIDHLPIYKDTNNQELIKGILFLKKIQYNNNIVFEYDLFNCKGNTIEEKLNDYILSIKFFEQYYK